MRSRASNWPLTYRTSGGSWISRKGAGYNSSCWVTTETPISRARFNSASRSTTSSQRRSSAAVSGPIPSTRRNESPGACSTAAADPK